jgi:hypothetical protein
VEHACITQFHGLSKKSLQILFETLLSILENIPTKRPKLITLTPPHKGHNLDLGWAEWSRAWAELPASERIKVERQAEFPEL